MTPQETAFSPTALRRDSAKNPHNPTCAQHYRRTCGACAHHTGQHLRSIANCKAIGLTKVSGLRGAHQCKTWTRKTITGEVAT